MNNWYLIYSKPKQEQRAQLNLANQGFESFAPLVTTSKIRGGKTAAVTEPLFPRYIFLNSVQTPNLALIRSTRGVAGLVKFGDKLASVSSALVHSLMQYQLALHAESKTLTLFKPGEKLEILTGPFAGLNAVFQYADGEQRSMILLNFLGQQLELSLPNQDLTRV